MLSEQTNETEPKKRNSGHTGPTSDAGKATSARNATRHGMCATTLIMDNELESDWLDLLQTWLEAYQSPAESTLLYTFVLKTAQAEWHRLRVQREYDFHLENHANTPIGDWQPHEIKTHDLILRYLTAAERRFQREYRMLEHHWKTHEKTQKPAPAPAKQKTPEIRYTNYPPPPDGKPLHVPPPAPSPGPRTRQAGS